ncbi:4Fe-4S binding protein [Bacteroides fragilis]
MQQGFLYPHINTTQCIDCGLCNKVCPVFRYDVISNKKKCKSPYSRSSSS